jgi:two-component system response regulator BaeR
MSNPEQELDAQPRAGDSPAERPPRVLVIDDEPTIRQILKIGLEAQGFAVSLAPNAQEGMNIVVSNPPALVILDLMMPQRDGWWFLREMQHHAGRRPLVIVLSARSGQGERLLAHHLGVAEYIVKPFDLDDVVHKVSYRVGIESASIGRRDPA